MPPPDVSDPPVLPVPSEPPVDPVSVPIGSSTPPLPVAELVPQPIRKPSIHAVVSLFGSAIAARRIKAARLWLRFFPPTDRHTYDVSRFLGAFSPRQSASGSLLAASQITNLEA